MSDHYKMIELIARGEVEALKRLYKQYVEKVYNTALSYTQNEQDAEEVTQDVFVSIHKNASKFKGEAKVSTWVYKITVNASLNAIKKRKRRSFLMFDATERHQPDFEHPGVVFDRREEAILLFSAIKTLPHRQKTAFILSFVEELPRGEVAEIMQLSLKAIESLLQRAKGNMREKLKNSYLHRRKNE